mmetsp:Transcript_29306/g.73022  ORF Transcript_29306/g.73022 Transcript_29306/m.73022 type:complete len:266 (+) Transcript_29306:670-1467(+)
MAGGTNESGVHLCGDDESGGVGAEVAEQESAAKQNQLEGQDSTACNLLDAQEGEEHPHGDKAPQLQPPPADLVDEAHTQEVPRDGYQGHQHAKRRVSHYRMTLRLFVSRPESFRNAALERPVSIEGHIKEEPGEGRPQQGPPVGADYPTRPPQVRRKGLPAAAQSRPLSCYGRDGAVVGAGGRSRGGLPEELRFFHSPPEVEHKGTGECSQRQDSPPCPLEAHIGTKEDPHQHRRQQHPHTLHGEHHGDGAAPPSRGRTLRADSG